MSQRKFKRILVPVADPSAGINEAVRRARALARKTNAGIELFNAIPSAMSEGVVHANAEHFTRVEAEQNGRWLERIASRLRRESIVVNTRVQTGIPIHEAILREVRLTRADLVVIQARKHIRQCPVPLLIVKGRVPWRSPRILAALDPLHINGKSRVLDDKIVDASHAFAAVFGGTVHVAHIYRPLETYIPSIWMGPPVLGANPAQQKAYMHEVRQRFGEALRRYGIAKSKAHLLRGDPAVELPVLARSMRASLVVMGAVSRSSVKRIFIGNTAERVLDSLRCDTLIVKGEAPSLRPQKR
jgi:nucleotide-binding universal stress UspA family protein